MKNVIFLDTGVLSLYQMNDKYVVNEILAKTKTSLAIISSELNFIELFNLLCREKGRKEAQIIMENLRRSNIVKFVPISDNISLLAGELKCRYRNLSMVDSVICAESLVRHAFLYTTETQFDKIKNLKVKKFEF
jgi:predicted nucleic acid-binding protein